MKIGLAVVTTGLCALLATAGAARAHHSFAAEFDAKQPITLTGTVTKIDWLNPHVWFYVDVEADDGSITNWGFEMGSPNILMRRGWRRDSMKIGDVVTVDGSRARDGSTQANARTIVLTASGQKLFAGSSQGLTP